MNSSVSESVNNAMNIEEEVASLFEANSSLTGLDELFFLDDERSEEELLEENLVQLRAEAKHQLIMMAQARKTGNKAAMEEAVEQVVKTRKLIAALEGSRGITVDKTVILPRIGNSSSGLTLSHRDLPKFQLASSVSRPFPESEVFESVEHFLSRFKKIVNGSVYRNVEIVWKQFLPLCLPYSDNAWIETELLKCKDWAEARKEFRHHHGSDIANRHYIDQVFTMKMTNKDTICEYSKKFQQTVYNAGLPLDDPRIADRFLASLTVPVQTLIKITIARIGRNKEGYEKGWTVEYITEIGRDILGDDNSLYAEAASLVPGARRNASERNTEEQSPRRQIERPTYRYNPYNNNNNSNDRRGNSSSHRYKHVKKYMCTHHGSNTTHTTSECYSIKKRQDPGDEKKCYSCGFAPWTRDHRCSKEKRVLAVSKRDNTDDDNDEVVKDKVADMAVSDVDAMVEDWSYQ